MKRVIIVGAGGHGRVIADIIKCCGDTVIGFLDDKSPDEAAGFHITGTTKDIGRLGDVWYFPAIGEANVRESLFKKNPNAQWYTAIHPSSVIADDVMIGCGTCVMANAVVNPGTKIGRGCIINTASTIDHDCLVADFVHVSPGVHVAGSVAVGQKTWIGVGASVVNNVSICASCIIGAGAVVARDIATKGTYIGVPAKLQQD